MLGHLIPALTIAVLVPLAHTSTVKIALCLNTGHWYSYGGGSTQGFCDVAASGGKDQFLHAASQDYSVAEESGLQNDMLGPGVLCSLDVSTNEVSARYWGGDETKHTSQCTDNTSGEPAIQFCAAHGFENADSTSFVLHCPHFSMEP